MNSTEEFVILLFVNYNDLIQVKYRLFNVKNYLIFACLFF